MINGKPVWVVAGSKIQSWNYYNRTGLNLDGKSGSAPQSPQFKSDRIDNPRFTRTPVAPTPLRRRLPRYDDWLHDGREIARRKRFEDIKLKLEKRKHQIRADKEANYS